MNKSVPKKILVAEDEKPMARALKLKLTHEGYEVVVAHDGETALKEISSGKFDLIMCDLVMPKVDGFEVLKKLKEGKSKIPIVILSNLSQEDDRDKALDLGASNFFIKSNTPIADIVAYVKSQLA